MAESARDLMVKHFRWIDGHADVWAIFRDAEALRSVVSALSHPYRKDRVSAVLGIESRGFLLGAAVAVELGVGFIPVRKADGLFPGDKINVTAGTDYRGHRHTLRMQRSAVRPGDRVLLVDDWIETGSQALATKQMVEQCGGDWVGCSVLVDDLHADKRADLGSVHGLLTADELEQ
jgi:adenine phosphoribosyltransferase